MNQQPIVGSSRPAASNGKSPARTYEQIGSDRLLSIQNVSETLGVCPVTASKIMKESGRSITLHRKIYILESSFLAYLREQEAEAC